MGGSKNNMAQNITLGGWVRAAGIVPVLFAMGVFLCWVKIAVWIGYSLIFISSCIGVTYGLLGVIGILKRMEMIETKKATISLNDLNIFKKN